jgi:hypothetical protein
MGVGKRIEGYAEFVKEVHKPYFFVTLFLGFAVGVLLVG